MSIRAKLILAFGSLIVILIVVIALIENSSLESKETYGRIRTELEPGIDILKGYKNSTNELELLLTSKVILPQPTEITNKIKALVQVELPNYRTGINSLKGKFGLSDPRTKLSLEIITETNNLIRLAEEVIRNLRTIKDYENKEYRWRVESKYQKQYIPLNKSLLYNIAELDRILNNEYKEIQQKLENKLEFVASVVLIFGIMGILLAFYIAFITIKSVTKPIQTLQLSAEKVAKGNFDVQISAKGKDEIALLSNSFNVMAQALKTNFEEIKMKNKELEQFAYIASHDLQEPLRTVTNYTGLLTQKYADKLDEEAMLNFKFVNESTVRMSQLIKGLLDYSLLGSKRKLEEIKMNTLVEEILKDLQNVIKEKKAKVTVQQLSTIIGERRELRQLIQNLISNSLKFTSNERQPEIKISCKKILGFWQFTISDNGIGIDENQSEKVFAIFQRLNSKKDYEGTGIGLSHCQKIADLHGGKIWFDSVLGKGTNFHFTIAD